MDEITHKKTEQKRLLTNGPRANIKGERHKKSSFR